MTLKRDSYACNRVSKFDVLRPDPPAGYISRYNLSACQTNFFSNG